MNNNTLPEQGAADGPTFSIVTRMIDLGHDERDVNCRAAESLGLLQLPYNVTDEGESCRRPNHGQVWFKRQFRYFQNG